MTENLKSQCPPSKEATISKTPWEKCGLTKEEFEEVMDVFRMLSEWDRELKKKHASKASQADQK